MNKMTSWNLEEVRPALRFLNILQKTRQFLGNFLNFLKGIVSFLPALTSVPIKAEKGLELQKAEIHLPISLDTTWPPPRKETKFYKAALLPLPHQN